MEEKSRLTVGACGKARVLLAGALKKDYVFAAALFIAAGAAMHLAGSELFQPAFAEQSDISQVQIPTGNTYHRSMTESMTVISTHGSGSANSPVSHSRSMSESMSVTTIQGKAPNSYSRSMSEQASLTTGMPPAPAGPQLRAAPAPATPYSASSNQRIDERLTPSLKMLGKKGDATAKTAIGGTPILATESIGLIQAGPPDQFSESGEISDDGSDDSSSPLLYQLDAFNEYVLMQESMRNVALLNASVSAVFLLGAITVVVAKQPAISGGRLQKGMYALFLRRCSDAHDATCKKIGSTGITHVLLLMLVIFTASSIVKAIDPLAGQAFAAISYVDVGAADTSVSDAEELLTPALPGGLQAGDVMIATYHTRGPTDPSPSVSISAGWTQIENNFDSNGGIAVWYRVYQGGDTAPTITSTNLITNGQQAGRGSTIAQVAAWRGVDTANPLDATGTTSTNSVQANVGPINGITLGASDIVIVLGGRSASWTTGNVPTLAGDSLTWIEIGESVNTTFGTNGMVWDYAIDGGSGTSVTSKTFTVSDGTGTGRGIMFSLNAAGGQSFQASPSDTLALTDTIARSVVIARAASDSLSVTDIITMSFAGSRAASEQIMMSDAVGTTLTLPRTMTEQLAAVDSLTESLAVARTITEQMAIDDIVSAATSRSTTEQLAVIDSIQRSIVADKSVSESMAITDTIAMAVSNTLAEQLSLTDQIDITMTQSKAISDQLNMTDAIAVSANKPLSEMLSMDDTIARSLTQLRSMTDQITMTDNLQRSIGAARNLSESMTMTDTLAISVSKSMSEQLSINDTADRGVAQSRQMSEQITIAESIKAAVAKPVSDQMVLTETTDRLATLFRSMTEQLTIEDTVSAVTAKSLSEQFATADTLARIATISRTITEQMVMTDAPARASSVTMTEQLGVTDSAQRGIVADRSVSESITVTDKIAKAVSKSITEQLTVEDSIFAASVLSGMTSDQLAATDSIAISASKPLSEQLGATDIIARTAITGRAVSEQMAASESVQAVTSKMIAEQLVVTDSLQATTSATIVLSEQLYLDDATSKSVSRAISESLAMNDSIIAVTVQEKTVSEQLSTVESIAISIAKSISEQLTISESSAFLVALSVTLSEQMATTDTLEVQVSKAAEEELAVQDVIDKTAAISRSMTEQLGVTESAGQSIAISISDQLGMTDSIAISVSVALAEQLAISDLITATSSADASAAEQLTVTESITIATRSSRSVLEQLVVSDAIAISITIPLAEQLGITDSLSATSSDDVSTLEQLNVTDIIVVSVSKPLSESLGMADMIARSIVIARTASDNLSLTDTVAKSFMGSRAATEQMTMTDMVVTTLTVSRTLSEQLAATDSLIGSVAVARTMTEQLLLTEQVDANMTQAKTASVQLGLTEFIAITVVKQMTDGLSLSDTIMITGSSGTTESMTMTDSISRQLISARDIAEDLSVTESTSDSPTITIVITDSMSLDDRFGDISVLFNLDIGVELVMTQGFATNFEGLFDQSNSEGIILGDSVVLVLGSPTSPSEAMTIADQITVALTPARTVTESMQIRDSLSILIVLPPPPPPAQITTMPNLVMTETDGLEEMEGIADPAEAFEVSGIWDVENLNEEGLESLLATMGMPVYEVSDNAASGDIGNMTMVLPTFRVSMSGAYAGVGGFLTPTLSDLPAGMQVIVPIDVQASMDETANLGLLGDMTVDFTPAASAGNFTMLITMLDNNPEVDIAAATPDDISAFYFDVSIAGDFGAVEPSDGSYFEELPEITFTVTEDWAEEQNTERDSNGVPVISLYLFDEGTDDWIAITDVDPPASAVGDFYTYTATLPHFSTYVVTAGTASSSGGGSGGGSAASIVKRSIGESMFVTTLVDEYGLGEKVVRDLAESLTFNELQGRQHQRVITIQNVTVAVNVADVKAAGFGTAFVILVFEITNKNGAVEELVLRYSYSDPATGQKFYGEQPVMAGAGESIVQTVRIPFSSTGVHDITIEAVSSSGTIATTDIAVDVPWLEVYIYMLALVIIALAGAPILFMAYAVRRTHMPLVAGTTLEGKTSAVTWLLRAIANTAIVFKNSIIHLAHILKRAFGLLRTAADRFDR